MIQSDGVRGEGIHPGIFVRRDGLACLVRDPYESDSLRLVLGICFVQMLDELLGRWIARQEIARRRQVRFGGRTRGHRGPTTGATSGRLRRLGP